MDNARWPAWLPLTGIAFVVLAVLAFIVGGETPDIDDPPLKILAFYKANDSDQIWAAALLGWATVFFLFFLGYLRSFLSEAEGGTPRLSAVAFAGGIIVSVGMLAFASFAFALGDVADTLTPQAAQALNALGEDFFFPVAAGVGALMISTGLIAIRTRALPAWLGWIALIIGIVAVTPLGFFGFLAFGLWVLVASVILWQGASSAAPPARPAA
jgi:hypothetical protein